MSRLGENLRVARTNAGFTQESLAKEIGVLGQTIYRWESGTRYPRPKAIDTLASTLGVTVAQLIGEADIPSSPAAPQLKVASTVTPAPKSAGGLDTQAAQLRDRIQIESGNLSDAMRARVQEILQECMRYLEDPHRQTKAS